MAFFSMKFDSILHIRNISSTLLLLLLLLLVANGNAKPRSRCGENRFFDRVAQICTHCNEICDPLRGTEHLCRLYADECTPAPCE